MSADRHLLFGLLALQNEFIDKRQLVAAFGAWIADHSHPLDEVLVLQKAIKEDDRALLSRLVDRHVAARGGDVGASLRSFSGSNPIREELERLADGEVLQSIAKLQPPPQNTIVHSMGQATSSGNRFEFRRPLDRGGLGIVSVALDKELNREVALKEIRGDRADDVSFRTKFLLEAEVTGGLEHPGIVPVYGFGTGPDGRPYYAMRLIRGDNLHAHIKRFHDDVASGKEPYDGGELRKLLRRFLDVCQAIDYAHSRGVLHRDLKPGNIMLGKYGETLVVDWGLAKPMGTQRRESLVNVPESSIETLLVPSGSNDGMTIQGSMVGTAAYAPPEQLSGNLELVNERSDIYGLGAVLYELLTNHTPARGSTLEEVVKAVLFGNIKPPISFQPQMPRALDAICVRAMARKPEDRYETAAELGLEIERWLDDLPVFAYPEPPSLRLRRWMRSHRTLVATASVIVLMSTVGLGLYSSIVSRNNTRLNQANTLAQKFKAEAISRYAIAKGAIDMTLLGTSDSLVKFPGTQRLQTRLLQQAADDFEKLSQNSSDDPELELERVRALVRLADIYHMQNNLKAAHDKYRESLTIIDSFLPQTTLAETNSDSSLALQVERGKIHARMGLAFDIENKFIESATEFERAEAILRPLLKQYPESALCRTSLATTLANKASLVERKDGAQAALPLFNESLQFFDVTKPTSLTENARAIARCKEGLGRVLRQLGKYDEARQAFLSASELVSQRLSNDPKDVDSLQDSASLNISKANLERSVGDFETAMADLEAATKIYKSLQMDYPEDLQLRELFAINETDIGAVLLDLGRPSIARERALPAAQVFDELVNSFPQIPSYREGLATALSVVAQASTETTPATPDIEGAFRKSIAIYEEMAIQLTQSEGGESIYGLRAATFKSQLARHLHLQNQFPEARSLFSEAIETFERSAKSSEGEQETEHLLAHAYWRSGLLEFDDQHPTEARALLSKAIDRWRARCKAIPSPENRFQLALCLTRTPESTLLNLIEAQKIMKDLHDASPRNVAYSNLLADILAASKDAKSSRQLLDEIKTTRENWNADDYCVLAKIQSLEGQPEEAHKSISLASEWATQHRPYCDDVQRFIANTKLAISPN